MLHYFTNLPKSFFKLKIEFEFLNLKKSIDKNENLQRQKAITIFKNMKDFFQRISEVLSKVKPFSKGKN